MTAPIAATDDRAEQQPEHQRAGRRHLVAGQRAAAGAAHDRVDVAVEVAVERVGAAGGERAAEHRDQRDRPRRQAAGGQHHRRQRGDEQQLDDARLGQRDVGGDPAAVRARTGLLPGPSAVGRAGPLTAVASMDSPPVATGATGVCVTGPRVTAGAVGAARGRVPAHRSRGNAVMATLDQGVSPYRRPTAAPAKGPRRSWQRTGPASPTTSHTVHPTWWTDLDTKAVDTARLLAADAVQKAGSGHPGTAMSLAPLAYLLYQRVMRHDPTDPEWVGRDRFILSNGHSSLTQYCQLFLSGYGLELSDLESLRTWESRTPGHPEYHHTAGVEITTGPLGQGVANGVGMAMASRRERGLFDPDAAPGESPFDHFIYVIAGDGCMEEGVASEASSLAGHQQLGNLILFYDDNHISIEDDTAVAFSEDVLARYEAYGWHVQRVDSGEDVTALENAIKKAQRGHRQAVVHRGAHDHRLAGADPAEHRQGARLGARRRRDRARPRRSSASTRT